MRVLGRAVSKGPVRCTLQEAMMSYKYDTTLCQCSGASDVAAQKVLTIYLYISTFASAIRVATRNHPVLARTRKIHVLTNPIYISLIICM